jgi:hypothetical protein
MQWGESFAAYAQLRSPGLHTLDVLDEFTGRFVAHYETLAAAIRAPLGELEQGDALATFEDSHGLERGSVSWDYDALELFMRSGYDVIERESGVYLFTKDSEPTQQEVIAGLNATSDEPEILARWEEGVDRWGAAFLAFAQLRLPSLHTRAVLTAFEVSYIASFDSVEDLANTQIEANGWREALAAFRARKGIGTEFLDWDHQAIYRRLELVYQFVWLNGQVHAFAK